jgi:hypothetical protein
MSSKFLKGHADALSDFARKTRARAESAPDDFFLQLAARSQEEAARDARHQMMVEEAEEAGELVDLRLLGVQANGSISLDWFLRAMDPLSKSWKLAAHRLRYGNEAARAVGADVVSALNLKLAGIGYGSTRIFVTGNAMPDLTGESLLQVTLMQVFRLLNARHDDFYDAVDAVGGRSAHQLGEFMKELDQAGLAAQFTWQSQRGRQFWEGRPDEIVRIRALLDTIREPERYQETITGSVAGIMDTGRLELRTDDGKIVVRFPLNLTEQVQRLTIRSLATINVETARYWDSVQKRDIYKRQLMSVH